MSSGSRCPIRRSASRSDAAYSPRSTTVTGSVATANSTVPSGRRSLRASGSAYSLTSSRAATVVTTSARSARARASRPRPPATADSRTLASATRRTPGLAPRLEAGLDVLLAQPLTPDAAPDLRAQAGEELALELEGQRSRWRWKENSRQPSPSRDENGIPRAQKAGRLVTELPNAADPHVVTTVAMIARGNPTVAARRGVRDVGTLVAPVRPRVRADVRQLRAEGHPQIGSGLCRRARTSVPTRWSGPTSLQGEPSGPSIQRHLPVPEKPRLRPELANGGAEDMVSGFRAAQAIPLG